MKTLLEVHVSPRYITLDEDNQVIGAPTCPVTFIVPADEWHADWNWRQAFAKALLELMFKERALEPVVK